jgi:thiol:disulfide interchange protein
MFQNPLQNPWIVLSLASLVFVMALNLFGVFELVLPGRFAGALASRRMFTAMGQGRLLAWLRRRTPSQIRLSDAVR